MTELPFCLQSSKISDNNDYESYKKGEFELEEWERLIRKIVKKVLHKVTLFKIQLTKLQILEQHHTQHQYWILQLPYHPSRFE